MVYDEDAWAPTKLQKGGRLDGNDTRILKWMCGVTKKDEIRNGRVRISESDTSGKVESRSKTKSRSAWQLSFHVSTSFGTPTLNV